MPEPTAPYGYDPEVGRTRFPSLTGCPDGTALLAVAEVFEVGLQEHQRSESVRLTPQQLRQFAIDAENLAADLLSGTQADDTAAKAVWRRHLIEHGALDEDTPEWLDDHWAALSPQAKGRYRRIAARDQRQGG